MNVWVISHDSLPGNFYIKSLADTEMDFIKERYFDAGDLLHGLPYGMIFPVDECVIRKMVLD